MDPKHASQKTILSNPPRTVSSLVRFERCWKTSRESCMQYKSYLKLDRIESSFADQCSFYEQFCYCVCVCALLGTQYASNGGTAFGDIYWISFYEILWTQVESQQCFILASQWNSRTSRFLIIQAFSAIRTVKSLVGQSF